MSDARDDDARGTVPDDEALNDEIRGEDAPGRDVPEAEGDGLAAAPRRTRVALAAAVALAIVIGGLVWVLGVSEPSTDRAAYSTLLDEAAPNIAGDSVLDGERFDLADHRGQWVVVNFFATWCQPCLQEHPELVALDENYGPTGTDELAVVSVVYDEDADEVVDLFEDRGGDWPVVDDPESQVALDYGVIGVPETYLVDPEGVVRQKLIGGVTEAGLMQEIEALEADLAGSRDIPAAPSDGEGP